jgi:hypothetical protein
MDGAVGAGPSGTALQASDQTLAGPDRTISEIMSSLLQWNETLGRPSTRYRTDPEARNPLPAPKVESNLFGERGNSDNRWFIPAAETVAAGAPPGARGDSIKDGMPVISSGKNERTSTRTTVGIATQDRRSGGPGKQRPGKGTKPKRGDAQHSLLGGEGIATSTVSGSSPPARRDNPSTVASDPDIARQGDISGNDHLPTARTSPLLTAGEIVYQCWEADAEIAEIHQALGLSGGALVC